MNKRVPNLIHFQMLVLVQGFLLSIDLTALKVIQDYDSNHVYHLSNRSLYDRKE